MAKKSKRFRVGVEGATTDGRTIERDWLTQMAETYDPTVYTALVNMEHIKGYTADSPFRRYGKVDKLEAAEISEGPLKGKMALYAWISPTDDLVALTDKWQKLFTSMEVNPAFADSGKAYLVGLAVTDDPASLGTEMLQFSATAPVNPLERRKLDAGNLFTAAEETVIEFEDVTDSVSILERIKSLFSAKTTSDEKRFSDVHQAVEVVALEHQTLSESVTSLREKQDGYARQLETLSKEFTELKTQLSIQDSRSDFRPQATGSGNHNENLTNC